MISKISDDSPQTIAGVDCVINQEYSVSCIQDGDEVYVPFSFIRDYFEVYGSLSTVGKGPPKFEWSHSNAKINYPKGTYDPKGIFMYFENYNVEVRFCMAIKPGSKSVNCETCVLVAGERSCEMYKCVRRCANINAMGTTRILLSNANRSIWPIALQQKPYRSRAATESHRRCWSKSINLDCAKRRQFFTCTWVKVIKKSYHNIFHDHKLWQFRVDESGSCTRFGAQFWYWTPAE